MLDDPAATVWLALDRGEAVGYQAYFRAEESADTMLIPDECIELCAAGTRMSARGKGIGQALTRHGLADARAKGYRYWLTD
jgi:ribosomal protein S18 acetylase RimI-like enzyme